MTPSQTDDTPSLESSPPPVVGIDFGGTSVKISVLRGSNLLEETVRIKTQCHEEAAPLIAAIAEVVADLRKRHTVAAIGCGMPGFVDFKTGVVHTLTNVKGWTNIPLKDELERLTGLSCTIENDANAMAYAEWKLGAGRGMADLVALTLGTGVGGAVIVNGQMVRGSRSGAGELGQTSIDYDGRVGAYGNRGSLEDYIGNREIAEDAAQIYKNAGQPREVGNSTPACLAEAAAKGDPVAKQIWEDIAAKLATALVNCCYLLNPEGIIIGGGVAQAGAVLFEPLRRQLGSQLSPPFFDHLKILPARFGNEAGMIGAASLALECAGALALGAELKNS